MTTRNNQIVLVSDGVLTYLASVLITGMIRMTKHECPFQFKSAFASTRKRVVRHSSGTQNAGCPALSSLTAGEGVFISCLEPSSFGVYSTKSYHPVVFGVCERNAHGKRATKKKCFRAAPNSYLRHILGGGGLGAFAEGGIMRLTRELLHSVATNRNGFNRHQLRILGLNWPPPKGWLSKLCGKEVPDDLLDKVRMAGSPHRRAIHERQRQINLGNISK